ncbi:GDSL esterase/lipase [Nymphaea thermarum]|nr:GDSL esterase/lipase [Nymphaea thermarum]
MPRNSFPSSRSLTNFFSFFFPLLVVSLQIPSSHSVTSIHSKVVPPLFVFGDSFLDNGNNLQLKNPSVHFDFLPYGVDFPKGPSGRVTNGRNPADILGQLLGIHDFLPAALDPETRGKRVLAGVNYASGGSGILEMHCEHSRCIPVAQQIKMFEDVTLPDLRSQLSSSQVSELLFKGIFLFSSGGNDCYKMCIKSTESKHCVSDESLHSLIEDYIQQLKNLYDLGARKFVLIGLQQLGCVPHLREKEGTCFERMNHAAALFNTRLRSSTDRMKQVMPGSHVVVVNTYNIIGDILDDPAAKGELQLSAIEILNNNSTVFSLINSQTNGLIFVKITKHT